MVRVCDFIQWLTGTRDHGGKRVEHAKEDKQKRTAAAAAILSDCDCMRKWALK